MSAYYAVIGHPIAHSKSPQIHTAFAAQTGQDLIYEAILAPLDGFEQTVQKFVTAGGKGANITVPFKQEAFRLAQQCSERARLAGAINTLIFNDGEIVGDNTDGAGLIADLKNNLNTQLAGRRVLLLGAGGAARGVIHPLRHEAPACIVIANRTVEKAHALVEEFGGASAGLSGGGFEELAGQHFDIVINATAASLSAQSPDVPRGIYAPGSLAYDMVYGKNETPFMQQAKQDGAERVADGLGMLVEQAAESFFLWRGVRPNTAVVLAQLRRV